jgi:hypothetical protein
MRERGGSGKGQVSLSSAVSTFKAQFEFGSSPNGRSEDMIGLWIFKAFYLRESMLLDIGITDYEKRVVQRASIR